MIELGSHPNGVVVPVRAQPRARQGRIVGEHAGSLKVAVTDAPEQGKANRSIAAMLADQLGLKSSQVQLLAGGTSRNKRFLLVNQHADEIRTKLAHITANARS